MSNYIIVALLTLLLAIGITAFSLNKSVIRLEAEAVALRADADGWRTQAQAAIDREVETNTRCFVTQKTVDDLYQRNSKLDELRYKSLCELSQIPKKKLLEETPNANTQVADDARLSADAMRLLNDAYCSGSPEDSSCSTSGNSEAVHPSEGGR